MSLLHAASPPATKVQASHALAVLQASSQCNMLVACGLITLRLRGRTYHEILLLGSSSKGMLAQHQHVVLMQNLIELSATDSGLSSTAQ